MPRSPAGHVVLVLHTHLPWVLGHGRWPHGQDWLHEAAAECYLPILRALDRIVADGGSPRITIGLTPVLCEMLASPRFREDFVAYLDSRRALADRDREEFDAIGNRDAANLASSWVEFYTEVARDFSETYRGDLLGAFRRLQDAGHVELITSAATHGYLPLLGRDASVEAQVRAGVASYRRHFGRAPRGLWLPECAYRPGGPWARPVGPPRAWDRPGLEEPVARHGLRFFFVDTHLVAGGTPAGTYGDRFEDSRSAGSRPATGLSPNEAHALVVRSTRRRVAVLARDPKSSVQVWSADYGYPGDGAYLEFHRRKGKGGLRYWRVTSRALPLDDKAPYDPKAADERVRAHAGHFVATVRETLAAHFRSTGRPGVVVAPFDTELFGHWWFEGARWLEAVLRGLDGEVSAATASESVLRSPPSSVVTLPEGSWGQGGHHWVWMNDGTRWVWEIVYRSEDAFLDLLREARRKRSGLVKRVLRQLARELLLLESSDWPFLITTVSARDYAE
ncbi:MAG TPA: 1,4-alpha-glucan branching protein domain-containing protein, partial [Thermoplasmata archaeon]|nr:1,4-alpha-glucan branching protein domain-containing protein [Thermoplasmata archaeon]